MRLTSGTKASSIIILLVECREDFGFAINISKKKSVTVVK